MATKLNFGRDVQGFNAYAPKFATNHFSATLENEDEKTFTVPNTHDQWIVSFSYQPGTNVWIALNETAATPTNSSFTSTHSELNPGARWVSGGDVIHAITNSTTADVGISLYAITT